MQHIDIMNLKSSCGPAIPLDSKYPFPEDKRITDCFKQTLSP
jgi:hypothetical protein